VYEYPLYVPDVLCDFLMLMKLNISQRSHFITGWNHELYDTVTERTLRKQNVGKVRQNACIKPHYDYVGGDDIH
jgi:hypothetical protein